MLHIHVQYAWTAYWPFFSSKCINKVSLKQNALKECSKGRKRKSRLMMEMFTPQTQNTKSTHLFPMTDIHVYETHQTYSTCVRYTCINSQSVKLNHKIHSELRMEMFNPCLKDNSQLWICSPGL